MAATDTVDFGDLGLTRKQDQEVREMLQAFEQKQRELDFAKARQAAAKAGVSRILRDKDGNGGSVTMRIPPWLYHKCGLHYGYECWDDDEFCRSVMKFYPETRVTTKTEKATIIVPDFGTAIEAKPKRYSKSFGADTTATQPTEVAA